MSTVKFLIPAFLLSLTITAQKPEVENYDLRGNNYSDEQIGITAKAYAKDKLVIVATVNKGNTQYENLVLDIVGDHIRAGRTKIMVLFIERSEAARTAVYLFAEGQLVDGVLGDGSDYGLTMTTAIKEAYLTHTAQP